MSELIVKANGLMIENTMSGRISNIKVKAEGTFITLDSHPSLDIGLGASLPEDMELTKGTAVVLTRRETEGEAEYVLTVDSTPVPSKSSNAPAASPALGMDLRMFQD